MLISSIDRAIKPTRFSNEAFISRPTQPRRTNPSFLNTRRQTSNPISKLLFHHSPTSHRYGFLLRPRPIISCVRRLRRYTRSTLQKRHVEEHGGARPFRGQQNREEARIFKLIRQSHQLRPRGNRETWCIHGRNAPSGTEAPPTRHRQRRARRTSSLEQRFRL